MMTFIFNTITSALDAESLPIETKIELVELYGPHIINNSLKRALSNMNSFSRDDLETLLERKDISGLDVFKFMQNHIYGFESIIREEALQYKNY